MVGGLVFAGTVSVVVSTRSLGATDPALASLLFTERPVEVLDASAMDKSPLPRTRGVTSTLIHTPALREPDTAVTAASSGGALLYVIVLSLQDVSATPRTSKPIEELLAAFTRSVALTIVPDIPCRLNLR
jgi:hypothetical protein